MKVFTLREINIFVKLCLPLVAAFMAQKGMQFIDTFMMGWIGTTALAAGALATNIFVTILVFCRGVVSSVGVTIVHARADESNTKIQNLLHQAFFLSLAISVPLMVLAWVSPTYLVMIGQDPKVAADAQKLLRGLTWGVPGFVLFYTMREFISAFGLARAIMVVSLISIPLTFFCNYILVFGKFGLPALGIAGIGYASAAVCWFMFASLLFYSSKQSVLKYYVSWRLNKPDLTQLKALWTMGCSSGIINVLDMVTFLASALFMGYFGITALASFQIALQCIAIAFNLPLAVSIITALEVGRAYANQALQQTKRFVYLGLCSGLLISLILAAIMLSIPHIIVGWFLPAKSEATEVYHKAQLFLIGASLIVCVDGMQILIIGALRGLKDTFAPMIISVVCYLLIGLTSAYLLGFHTSLGDMGIWYGIFLGIFSLCIISGLRLRNLLFVSG